jgi:hypothetical protein
MPFNIPSSQKESVVSFPVNETECVIPDFCSDLSCEGGRKHGTHATKNTTDLVHHACIFHDTIEFFASFLR